MKSHKGAESREAKRGGTDGESFDKMAMRGEHQGNMTPTVEDYQQPMGTYAEHQFGKTLQYESRQNKTMETQAKSIKGQAYKGRYS